MTFYQLPWSCFESDRKELLYPIHQKEMQQRSKDEAANQNSKLGGFNVLIQEETKQVDKSQGEKEGKKEEEFPRIGALPIKSNISSSSVSFSEATTSSKGDSGWRTQTKQNTVNTKSTPGASMMYRGSSSGIRPKISEASKPSANAQPSNKPTSRHHQNLPMTPECTLELYDFPTALKTADMHALVQQVPGVTGHYRLKWQHDTSCWLVLESAQMTDPVLEFLGPQGTIKQDEDKRIYVRRWAAENVVPVVQAPTNEATNKMESLNLNAN